MRRIVFVAMSSRILCRRSPRLAGARTLRPGFWRIETGERGSTDLAVGGLVAGSLTPNIQVVGEAGRISNVLPSTVDTLLVFSPIGVGCLLDARRVRFTSATSGIRPYAETSAGFARLHTEVAGFGSRNASWRTPPCGSCIGLSDGSRRRRGTFESGRFVADVGYRYRGFSRTTGSRCSHWPGPST